MIPIVKLFSKIRILVFHSGLWKLKNKFKVEKMKNKDKKKKKKKKNSLLHDFVATLRLSALPSALYFILSKLAL